MVKFTDIETAFLFVSSPQYGMNGSGRSSESGEPMADSRVYWNREVFFRPGLMSRTVARSRLCGNGVRRTRSNYPTKHLLPGNSARASRKTGL
jgi:hypothetical protein